MILGNIQFIKQYKALGKIYNALQFFSDVDLSKLAIGQIDMEIPDTRANVIELYSKQESQCVFEAHKKYIDIHLILSGVEGIAISDVQTLNSINKFDQESDIGFYSGEEWKRVYLSAGDFLICYPEDAHKPAIAFNKPDKIKKIVIKIKV